MNNICNQKCGKHAYSIMSTCAAENEIAILILYLKAIMEVFEDMDLDKKTIRLRHTYVNCDGTVRVCVGTYDEAIDDEIQRISKLELKRKPNIANERRQWYGSKIGLSHMIRRICAYWDFVRTATISLGMCVDTFADGWIEKFANIGLDKGAIRKLIMDVEICDIGSDSSSDDSDTFMDAQM